MAFEDGDQRSHLILWGGFEASNENTHDRGNKNTIK